MKTFTKSLMILAAVIASLPAYGQFFSFDEGRTVLLAKPANMLHSTTGEGAVTNYGIDTIGSEGIATVAIYAATNGSAQTLVAQLETSDDQAVWTSLTNYAVASQNSIIVTNRYYGTNGLTSTNVFFLNGTIVTPTAATAGFSTRYFNQGLYTNVGTTVNIATNQFTIVGYNVQDNKRYLRINFKPGGTLTNNWTGAIWSGRKQQFP